MGEILSTLSKIVVDFLSGELFSVYRSTGFLSNKTKLHKKKIFEYHLAPRGKICRGPLNDVLYKI